MKGTKRCLRVLGRVIAAVFLCMTIVLLFGQNVSFAVEVETFVIDDNGVLVQYNGPGGDVIIPDGVTAIGDMAFWECENLTSVTVPDGVTSIGFGAFVNCHNLASINIPDGVISIGNSAFESCRSLTGITIPSGVSTIGQNTFYGCSSLSSIIIPDGVTSIGNYAFGDCYGLTSITIADSVSEINAEAFLGCSSLTSINIPKNVTTIPYGAFWGCSSLTNVTVSKGVKVISDSAFRSCVSLTTIILPDSVTTISYCAFRGCDKLSRVVIPDSVTRIESYAFDNCISLKSITIPSSVTFLEVDLFYECSEDLVIRVYKDSYAEQYFRENSEHTLEVIEWDPSLKGCSVDLSDIVNLKFYFAVDDGAVASGNIYAAITYKSGAQETQDIKASAACTLPDGSKAYVVECKLAPKSVNDEVIVRLMNRETGEALTVPSKYSVKAYCTALLEDDSFPEAQKELVRSLMSYATYSQLYFGYETSNLTIPKDEAVISTKAKVRDYLSNLPEAEITNTLPEGVTFVGTSLVLNSSIAYRLYFELADESVASQYGLIKNPGNGYYYLEDVAVSVTQLTDVMEFTFGNAVIKSCPMSYVNTVVNGNNGTKLTDLCISIFDYYSAAKDYLDYMASNAGSNETPVKQ